MKHIFYGLLFCVHMLPATSSVEHILSVLRTDSNRDIAAYATSITSLLESLPAEQQEKVERIIATTINPQCVDTLAVRLKALSQIMSPNNTQDLFPVPTPNKAWYKQPTYPVQTPEETREYTQQNSYMSVLQPVMWVFAGVIVILYIQSTRMPTYTRQENRYCYHDENVISVYGKLAAAVKKKQLGKK